MAAEVRDAMEIKQLTVGRYANADLPAAPRTGTILFDNDASKLVVWTGAGWEQITSA